MINIKYVPKEIVDELKKMDLYTYYNLINPSELVYEGNDRYCTKTHDSLKISNGMWNWFSRRCRW